MNGTTMSIKPQASTVLTLDQLKVGQAGEVVGVDTSGSLGRRLLELGIVPGREVRVVRLAPLGDPIEVDLKSSLVSLRNYEAALVDVSLFS